MAEDTKAPPSADVEEGVNTVSITINGVDHVVPKGERLITAAEGVGEYIPRFCHHDKLEPVGKCRMCLVEVDGPRGPALMPSCTMGVSDGMVVNTENEIVKKAQEGILEFLLLNHPLDCPVCDKGGECPLQDQAVSHGRGESRFVEEKRTYLKPLPISGLVLLDRERCVLCDRCVRVADDIAGDPLIEFIERGSHVQINTFPNEPFSSYFSGNTIQVCPVGALTSIDYRFKARPWDLEKTKSVSLTDSLHSSVEIHTTRGKIVRVYGVDNEGVNEGWLSDRDRFSFGAFESDERVTMPLIKDETGFREASWVEAITVVGERLGSFIGTEVGAIGGANGTNEEAFALGKFMRSVVGTPHIDAQVGDGIDPHLAATVLGRAKIADIDDASSIIVWAPDLKETLPVLYLRIRKAVRNGASLTIVTPFATGLDSIASEVVRYRPGSGAEALRSLAKNDEPGEGNVVAIVGRTSITEDPRLVEGIAAHIKSLPNSSVLPVVTRANTFGALDMGLAPTLLPGRASTGDAIASDNLEEKWGPVPGGSCSGKPAMDAMGILEALADSDLRAVVLAGSDPVRDCPDPDLAARALDAAEFVVAFDAFVTDSSSKADVILPAAVWGEVDGTVTNIEGRVQRVTRVAAPKGQAMSIATALDRISQVMGSPLDAGDWKVLNKEISDVAPAYAGMTADYLTFETNGKGAIVPLEGAHAPLGHIPVDVSVPVVTDRYTLHLSSHLYDDGVISSSNPLLSGLPTRAAARLHPQDAASLAVQAGERVKIGHFNLPVALDDRVAPGSVVVPFNHVETRGMTASPSVQIEVIRGDA